MDNITDRSMELRWEQKWPPPTPISSWAIFEQKALAAATHSPLFWWRYIDDIFLLWTHGEEKLNDFITYLNNLHPTIKKKVYQFLLLQRNPFP